MKRIQIDAQNYLIYRDTPWDKKVLNMNTNEILELCYTSRENINKLLINFNEYNYQNNIGFTNTRIDSENNDLKKALLENNFYYAETSYSISKKKLSKCDFGAIVKNNLELSLPDEEDFKDIKKITENSFFYSRFHDDPFIKDQIATNRLINWIDNLREQNKKFIVYKKNNKVISFLAYSNINKEKLDLILAGSDKNHGMKSFYFWSSFLTYFQKKGINEVETMISASNLGILNLYVKFGFKFEKTLLGFHKLWNGKL